MVAGLALGGGRPLAVEIAGLPDDVGEAAVLRVVVEDAGRADAAATTVARVDAPLAGLSAEGSATVRLTVPGDLPGRQYYVRAHLDANGSGEVTPGDRVSTASYPVRPSGASDAIAIKLQPVT